MSAEELDRAVQAFSVTSNQWSVNFGDSAFATRCARAKSTRLTGGASP